MVEVMFLGGVYGVGEYFSLAGFCAGCNIVSAFLWFRAAQLVQLTLFGLL